MSETMYLMGSEDVSRAGHNISGAASEMLRASANFDDTAFRLMRSLDEHASRMEAVVERMEKLAAPPEGATQ